MLSGKLLKGIVHTVIHIHIINNDLLTMIHNTKKWCNFINQTDITVHQEGRETLVL